MSVTDLLLGLYRVDQQLRSLRSRVDAAQRYYDAQERQLTDLSRRREQLRSQARQLQASAANLETEVQGLESRIAELRQRMNQAHSAKEYNALLTELNTVKLEKDKIESRAIEELGRVDAINAQLTEVEGLTAEREKVRDVARQQLEKEQAEIAARLSELESQRRSAAGGVPPDALREFETLARHHDGEAMAEIVEEDRRRMEYACGACHMSLPIETFSVLLGRDQIAMCPSCRRILYIPEELRGALDKRLAGRS